MNQNQRIVLVVLVLFVLVGIVLGVNYLQRQRAASSAPDNMPPGSIPIFIEGSFTASFLPDDLNQLESASFVDAEEGKTQDGWMLRDHPHKNEVPVILNTIIWFLEKLALRGELTWSDKDIPLAVHLDTFEKMIMGYFDQLSEDETTLE